MSHQYNSMVVHPHLLEPIVELARASSAFATANNFAFAQAGQARLYVAFAANPCQSRQMLFHAGQMLIGADVYPVVGPSDTLRVFMAYLVILAFAKYGPISVRDAEAMEPLRLDVKTYCRGTLDRWLGEGGAVKMGSCDRVHAKCATEPIMQDAYRAFGRMAHWGLAERLFSILVHFNDLEARRA